MTACPWTGMFGAAAGRGAEPDEASRIFSSNADAGGNFINTSEACQLGQAESLIGEFIAEVRRGIAMRLVNRI